MSSLSSPIRPTIDVVARTVSSSVISGGNNVDIQPQESLIERNLEVQTSQNNQQTQEISALKSTVYALRTETSNLNNKLIKVEYENKRNLEVQTSQNNQQSQEISGLKSTIDSLNRSGALAIQPRASLVNVERNLEVQTSQNNQQSQEISGLKNTIDSLNRSGALAIQPQASLVNVERNLEVQTSQNNQQSQEISGLKNDLKTLNRSGALAIQPQASLVNVERNLEVQTAENVKQTQEISGLKSTVDPLRAEIATLNDGLVSISNLIRQDSAIEKQQEAEKAESERKLAEKNVRLGKESQLEQNITNSLVTPVQALQQKVGNIFGRIGEALTTLFAGWLTNQGIESLKAASEGNKEKLEEIKNNVLKTIGFGVAAIGAIKIGFDLVIKTITGITGKIGGLVLKLATAPLKVLRSTLQAAPIIGPLLGGPKPGPKPPGGGGMLGGAKNALKGLTGPLLQGTIGTGIDIAMGEDPGRAVAGAVGGVIAAAPAAAVGGLLGPLGSFGAGLVGYGYGSGVGKDLYDKFFGESETPAAKVSPTTTKVGNPKPTPAPEPPPTIVGPIEKPAAAQAAVQPQNSIMSDPAAQAAPAAVQPQTPIISPPSPEMVKNFEMAWKYKDNPMARGRIESAWNNMTVEQQQQAKIWANTKGYDWTEMKLVEKPPTIQALPLPSAQVQPLPKPTQNVGELPEPSPSVIMMPSGQGNNQQSSISRAPTNSTDTPLISSSNPDNFYVLYSQLNYNVVI